MTNGMDNNKCLELNIVDRTLKNQSWTDEQGKLTTDDIDKVHEQKTGNGGALNALPTPFARFFIFKEAFRRVLEEKISPSNEAGLAYTRLVSDCLDVFELLFNLTYHRNHWGSNRDIVIKEWNYEEEMPRLEKRMPILYNAVKGYYGTDIKLDRLFFIILKENGKEKLLATSSPLTGFVTPPDIDRKDKKNEGNVVVSKYLGERYSGMKLLRKPMDGQRNRGCYFGKEELFGDRPADFKNYMYQMLNAVDNKEMKDIKNYITSFGDTDKDILIDYTPDWVPIESENNETLEFAGITVCCSNALDVNRFFTDDIIKLPYRISSDNFYTPVLEGKQERNYDYLLPLTEEAMGILDTENISCSIKEKINGKKVVVELMHKGKTYSKSYDCDSMSVDGAGRIIDFANPFKVNVDFGLFPNIKSSVREENNYFKFMLVTSDDNEQRSFDINGASCTFFAKSDEGEGNVIIEEAEGTSYTNGVRQAVVRSEQNDDVKCGTKFYEVFNTEISAISLHLTIEGKMYSGVLVPKWHMQSRVTKEYTYAIDFGTSNTYISKRLKGSNLEPEQLTMSETMMSYLHGIKKSRQQNLIDLWENIPFEDSADFFHTEFVPPFIDGKRYKFPLRTAMARTKRESHDAELFANHNIAFSYEKRKAVGDNEITTDLKWNENSKDARLFIRELLMIVKCDALLSDAKLGQTEIVWFYPLSLSQKQKSKFDAIWSEETRRVLGIPEHQVRAYTESEAPYYYYAQKDVFDSIDSVAVIDIGGGSTDMVYFKEGKPEIANSVHFGCDVLWGNGYNKMSNARDNGVFNRYKGVVNFGGNEELENINSEMVCDGSTFSTRDIIDFWISNSDKIRVGDDDFAALLRQDCKPLFLYHYASIIFYMANMFKAEGLVCPNAITFSGNGSKYIDGFITSDINTLTDMTMVILKAVYGDDVKRVQLILRDCRKESTCYGGLYRDAGKPSPKTVIFNGVDSKQYDTVADLTKDFENGALRDGIIGKVETLNRLYLDMLGMLVRNEELDNVNTKAIEEELCHGTIEALDKNFKVEIRDSIDPNVKYKDTMFFIPVIDKVTELTMVNKYIK